MTYAQYQTIEANDYNTFVGNVTGNVSGAINPIWSVGNGNAGYGQTSNLSLKAPGEYITSVEWSQLAQVIANVAYHQTGVASNVSMVAPAEYIEFRSELPNTLSSLYTNRLIANTVGSTTNSLQSVVMRANSNVAATGWVQYNVSFGNVDQTRYFFNAGGYLTLAFESFSNALENVRGDAIETLIDTNFDSKRMNASSFGARTGAGGVIITDVTTGAAGYYGITTTPTEKFRVESSTYYGYTTDYFLVQYSATGGTGSNNGNGNDIAINAVIYSASVGSSPGADRLDVNVTMRLSVVAPETVYLSNTWGTPVITKAASPVPAPLPPLPGSVTFSTPGSYLWTVPVGLTSINVNIYGAGGGGGAPYFCGGDGWVGGGGSSGGYYVNSVIPVTPGETLTIFVGAPGIGGSYAFCSSTGSTAGGDSYIQRGASVLINATGGGGGGIGLYSNGPAGTPNGVQGAAPCTPALCGYGFNAPRPGGNNGTGYGTGGNGGYFGGGAANGGAGFVNIYWG